MSAAESGKELALAVRAIEGELKKFSKELAARERWLVLNKNGLGAGDGREARAGNWSRRCAGNGRCTASAPSRVRVAAS